MSSALDDFDDESGSHEGARGLLDIIDDSIDYLGSVSSGWAANRNRLTHSQGAIIRLTQALSEADAVKANTDLSREVERFSHARDSLGVGSTVMIKAMETM